MKHYTFKSKYATYEDCVFNVSKYYNGNTAIEIWSNSEGPITRITVNPDIPIPKDMIAVKDYSENEGMSDWLISMNLVEAEPVQAIPSGWVMIPVYRMTEYGKEVFNLD